MSSTLPVSVTGMTFDDEFNTFSNSPDGSSGTWMTTYPQGGEAARTLTGNSEGEYYSDSSVGENPFSDTNGVLSISATPAAAGSNPYDLPYDSGVITTDKSFSQTYGYFEVTAELPAGQGLWPAFWMLPASNVYTSELDIFEAVDSNVNTIYSTTHGSTDGAWSADSQAFSVADYATGFHTYGVDWEPTTITFYVDGVETGSAPTPSSMDDPMYMLLNLAVGGTGSWPGAPDSTTPFPATMQIDDVRAYSTANTAYVGGSAAITPGSSASVVASAISPAVTGTAAATDPAAVTVGSGVDTLALSVSEDAWQGDAQFTVSIDGVQIGGTQTATALNDDSETQTFNVEGNFTAGSHDVTVDFLNDDYGGTVTEDRNLYVDGATIDGTAVAGADLSLYSAGGQDFSFTETSTASGAAATAVTDPAPVAVGSGTDTLALSVSEDAWQGDAQFTISVDGVQIGGTQTTTAINGDGATQTFDVAGNFAAGDHEVAVDFLNDAYGGTATEDRNLYVDGATIDGTAVPNAALTLDSAGSQEFAFDQTSSDASVSDPTAAASGGIDTIDLAVSEDAWQGDAQYSVTVDGIGVGGVSTATALHADGADNNVVLTGNWGTGAHTIGITFLNDAYGGTAGTDRNLYVDSLTYNGQSATPASEALKSTGTANFTVPGVGGDPVTLQLAEDAYQGNAQYSVTVDGATVIQDGTVTALQDAGQTQSVSFTDGLAVGWHDLAVSFLNDKYGGTTTTDRNLYIDGVQVGGTPVSGATATLDSTGTTHFSIYVPQS